MEQNKQSLSVKKKKPQRLFLPKENSSHDPLEIYLKEIRKTQLLNHDEETGGFKYLLQFIDLDNLVMEQLVKEDFEMARRKGLGEEFGKATEAEGEELDDGIYIVN